MIKRLLLEGPDDDAVVGNLLFNHDLDEMFELKQKKGAPNLLATFADELQATDIDCIGVVMDADSEMTSRWGSLSYALREAGYTAIPVAPGPEGTIIVEEGLIPVGIWMMPDNRAVGAIEDFISSLITPADVLWPKAKTMSRPFRPLIGSLRNLMWSRLACTLGLPGRKSRGRG